VPDQEALIFEVSKNNFNTSVVLNSHKLPVVVEFMGAWSGPCIQMEDTLRYLATEYKGQFVFAKVDVNEQPELMKEYNVENVPTIKIFKDGEVVRTEEGLLEESELKDILKVYGIFHQSDDTRELARQKHISGETLEAITLLTKAIQQDPGNTRIAMDMVQIFLDINELEQAKSLFNRLPEKDRTSNTGKTLFGQLTIKDFAAKTDGKAALTEQLLSSPDNYDAMFDLSLCLIADHDYKQALDHLFNIFEQSPEYKEGAAKEMIINISNILSENEPDLSQEIRRRLGSSLS